MTKISELADKFSMKLSLEPRPFAPNEDYQPTVEDIDPEYIAPEKFLSKVPNTIVDDNLDLLKTGIHNIAQAISLGDLSVTMNLIYDAQYNLRNLEKVIERKMSKNASIEDEVGDDETIYHDIEEHPISEPMVHLPALLKEYLQNLDYMDRDGLRTEKKRLMNMAKQFASQDTKPPYLLQKRIEEVDKRLVLDSSCYF